MASTGHYDEIEIHQRDAYCALAGSIPVWKELSWKQAHNSDNLNIPIFLTETFDNHVYNANLSWNLLFLT